MATKSSTLDLSTLMDPNTTVITLALNGKLEEAFPGNTTGQINMKLSEELLAKLSAVDIRRDLVGAPSGLQSQFYLNPTCLAKLKQVLASGKQVRVKVY